MGKHKIVKSAAAVALVASAVTAVAPGASAASYKVNAKDQLVSSTTGKLVKGWKVFGGKLYKNGKLAPAKKYKIIGTGAAQRLYYGPTLKKGYKTAKSATLLFKDGKLADGWKQASKNERLYKNGKLDKGYTVYNDVEGEKFLYQNGQLKKGLKTATRGGETNLFQDGKLAKGLVDFGGKTYNNGKLANGTIEGKEYKNGVVVVAEADYTAKSINSTTVEVTFAKAIDSADIKAENFAIEGLTVSNAVVKQSDAKTVILTTSTQEGGKEYAVSYKGAEAAKFTAINSAIPVSVMNLAVKPHQTSQQAKIGDQVTAKAQVQVAEGQSKAGIPVTFVIDNNTDTASGNVANQGKDITVEALTDENGIASYTYTQYAASKDSVTAYATGAPTQRSTTNVFWDVVQPLSVTDVTPESTVALGHKKVYKVATTQFNKDAKGNYVNVTLAENYNVTPEKVQNAVKIDEDPTTPFQSSVSGKDLASKVVKVYLDENGEATFTVNVPNTSANTKAITATPVVFVNSDSTDANVRLDQTELQATANAVTFQATTNVQVSNSAIGTQFAAAAAKDADFTTGKREANQGGRSYESTVKDLDGKTAAADTVVYLTFAKGENTNPAYDNSVGGIHVYDKQGKEIKAVDGKYALSTDKNGKLAYSIASEKANSYAIPVLTLKDAKDGVQGEQGEITYFGDATVAKAELTVNKINASNGVVVKNTKNADVVYQTVDQNGFPYAPAKDAKVTFNFGTTFGQLSIAGETVANAASTGNQSQTIALGKDGKIAFTLTTTVDTTATFTATGNLVELNNTAAKIVFENVGKQIVASVTDAELAAVNKSATEDEVKEALANNDAFNSLKEEQQAKLVDAIVANLKASKAYTVASLSAALKAAIDENTTPAPAPTPTPEVSAELEAFTAAIAKVPAAADVKVEDAEAIEAARAAFDKLSDAEKTAQADKEETLKAAEKALKDLEGETPVETAKTVAELVADKKVTLTTPITGTTALVFKASEFDNATAFTLTFEDKTTATAEKIADGIYKFSISDQTKEAVEKATLTATK